MAKFSHKMMGKEVGQASVYAEPHTMTGKVMKASPSPGKEPNRSRADTVNMSVGGISNKPDGMGTKTNGIKTRGNGCATKGTIARGPMA
jgi:hypothetical protein